MHTYIYMVYKRQKFPQDAGDYVAYRSVAMFFASAFSLSFTTSKLISYIIYTHYFHQVNLNILIMFLI